MKTPSYWNSNNLLSSCLSPFGSLYALATRLRLKFKKSQQASKPVICIGNLTAGGTGKTPVAVSIAKLLQTHGKKPFFVSRGYGGTLKSVMVDNKNHSAQQVGDEPLLLARQAPVIVDSERYNGACLAISNGAEIIIMDDGFQNPSLKKDLSFLVFDGNIGIGNGLCIPAGPLRENFKAGLKRAQAVIIIGEDKHDLASQVAGLPVFKASIQAVNPELSATNIIAFAGIGRPEKFYNSLKLLGCNIIKTFNFADHHYYTKNELDNLLHQSRYFNAELVTTAKDFVKIPADLQPNFKVLEIEIKWEDENSLSSFILSHL